MQNINLDLIHIKVTNVDGYEVYINDIDNLKFRVIRAAHSIRRFTISFTTFHWQDRDNPIRVRILEYDPKDFVTFNPDHPPCVRSLMIQNAASEKNPRKFKINGVDDGSYFFKIELVVNKLKEKDPDIVSLHDYLDDAKLLLEETPEEADAARKLFINTYRSQLGADYNYAVLISKLFKKYLPKDEAEKVDAILLDTYKLIHSKDIFDKAFRAEIPKISKDIKDIIKKYVTEAHFSEFFLKHKDHPKVLKAANKPELFDKMFDALLAIDKNLPAKKEKKVQFSTQILETRLARLISIIDLIKGSLEEKSKQQFDSCRLFQPGYKVKALDEGEIESYVKAIETNEAANIYIHRLFKSLEAKSGNIVLHQALINRIIKAKKQKDLFRAAFLTADLKVLIDKWNECHASPTKVPALQI